MAIFLWFIALATAKFLQTEGSQLQCTVALGLQDRTIQNSQLTASTSLPSRPASAARLNNAGAWCFATQNAAMQFLAVDLGKVKLVSGLQSQGLLLDDKSSAFAEKFTVQVATTEDRFLSIIDSGKIQVFTGNNDANSIKKNMFINPVPARYIRIFPQPGKEQKVVCMRLELLGCHELSPPSIQLQPSASLFVGEKTFFECVVSGWMDIKVSWLDEAAKSFDTNMVEFTTEKTGELQIKKTAKLAVNKSVPDIISAYGGYSCSVRDSKRSCLVTFQCAAEYTFNSTLSEMKNISITFMMDDPKPPQKITVQRSLSKCVFSFSKPTLGSFSEDQLEYLVSFNNSGVLRRFSLKNTKSVNFIDFEPYKTYEFNMRINIKISDWRTESTIKIFRTLARAPESSPVITNVVAMGSKELRVHWKKPDFKPENGVLSRYQLKISQFDYGGKLFPINGMTQITKVEDNISGILNQYDFVDLREWSTYNLTLCAFNDDNQKSRTTRITAQTEVGKPSGAPQNITLLGTGARHALISWEKPPFLEQNGEISSYSSFITKFTPGKQRKRRSDGGRREVGAPPHKFTGLKPFTTYLIEIAAKTSKGTGKSSKPFSFKTLQAAPSVPKNIRFSRDLQDNTWTIYWDPPEEKNGIIISYVVEFVSNSKKEQRKVNGEITSLNSQVDTKYGLEVRIKARTIEHGEWSKWIKKAPLPFIPTKQPNGPGGRTRQDYGDTLLIIIIVLVVLVCCVLLLMVGAFILYRRRDQNFALKVTDLNIDMLLKAPDGNPEEQNNDREKLVRPASIDQNTDNTGSIEDEAHPLINAEDFLDYVKKMKENEDEKFLHEYKYDLMFGKRYSCEVASRPENKSKNRYANITAYDHSRIVLKLDSNRRKGETDYFNGNTIQGYTAESNTRYIACHGPTEMVAADFWRMVWQENSNVIVMLTKFEEGRKTKCYQYWPTIGTGKYGQVTVTTLSTDQTADYFIRILHVSKGGETRTIRQFHFVSWPDHGVPEFPTSLLSMRRRVRHYHKEPAPMIVHCSAGVGRTGCFILIDAMLERLDNEGTVDLFNYLQYMRTRRINMVQTLDQYIFAHDAVLEYILCGNTEISVSDLERRIKELKRGSGMEEEYIIVESTSPDQDTVGNVYKVLLRVGRFVDASYVDGYKQRDAFILCQSPTQAFVEDFWNVVKEKNVHTIVMLNRIEENPSFCQYWPSLHETRTVYGGIVVRLTSEARNGNIMSRKIKLMEETDTDDYEVQHFQFLDWPEEGVPSRRSSLLTLMALVEKSQQQFGNGPILVHCSNGHGRSGTFAAVYNTTERLKVEQLIDVLQCVRAIRLSVPNAVDNLEQYQFIYNMIRTFLEAFATYSNFEQ